MEESEKRRISLSEPGASFWPHKPTTLTPAVFLFAPVFLCPFAVLFSPASSLFQNPHAFGPHVSVHFSMVFQPELFCSI